ncbi:hypothetical protein [Alishewanella phage vB_AspM_Slicko01]|nr:hypothetical protein [Alishewanella phage vB_AspM_Slicko01]
MWLTPPPVDPPVSVTYIKDPLTNENMAVTPIFRCDDVYVSASDAYDVEAASSVPSQFSVNTSMIASNQPLWGQAASNSGNRTGASCLG